MFENLPSADKLSSEEFKAIHNNLGINNVRLAEILNCHKRSIEDWRSGRRPLNGPVSFSMRVLDQFAQGGLTTKNTNEQ